ncbi:hypothetical protein [Spirosoma sp. KUDC1026]|uniref:DUF6712 family protein n=1 Tax=Spirosoma sp. KUDC1026 TaxID=2745947 RepID=UPI00159BD064|nr:hypothetical protein [Spirosoma sp. KUDC1026]QKZ15197.1 hypothetical protein HU175_22250 [Spirosoma sp. KUDC1026]
MEPLLSLNDIEQYIGPLPVSVKMPGRGEGPGIAEKLTPIVSQVAEGWLADVLESATITAYRTILANDAFALGPDAFTPTETLTAEQFVNGRLIRKFMTYAVWSIYLTRANVTLTQTGFVNKSRDQSQDLSTSERLTLVKQYEGLASRVALQLSKINWNLDQACPPASGFSGRPTIRKAQRRSPSRLGN